MPTFRRVDLSAAPLLLLATVLVIAGPPLAHPLAAQTLTGTVYDSTAAAPLAGARVVVSGTDRTAVTDTEGRFRLEGLEPGEYVVGFFHARLEELGVAPGGRVVWVPDEGTVDVALAVPSPATIAAAEGPQRISITVRGPAVVVGRVLDGATDEPVRGATVRLRDTGFETLADTVGWFAFPEVPAGDYLLEIEHIAYGTQSDSLAVPAETTVDVVFRASAQAIALDPLEVTVLTEEERRRRAAGFAGSMYITRDQIEEYYDRGAFHVGDLLRMHSPTSVRVRPRGISGICVEAMRRAPGLRRGRGCAMVTVIVDGMFDIPDVLTDLPMDAIESIAFLPPMAAMTRYGGRGLGGVVEITTDWGVAAGAGPPSGEEIAEEMRERYEPPSRGKYWLVGGALGGGTGLLYVATRAALFCDHRTCRRPPPAELAVSMVIGVAIGWLAGEAAYRSW